MVGHRLATDQHVVGPGVPGGWSTPNAVDALPWGSRSITSTERPPRARAAARLTALVVLPTPPFWLATTKIRVAGGAGKARGDGVSRETGGGSLLGRRAGRSRPRRSGPGGVRRADGMAGRSAPWLTAAATRSPGLGAVQGQQAWCYNRFSAPASSEWAPDTRATSGQSLNVSRRTHGQPIRVRSDVSWPSQAPGHLVDHYCACRIRTCLQPVRRCRPSGINGRTDTSWEAAGARSPLRPG